VRGPAPHKGEHNHDILTHWLGLERMQIDALEAAGIVVP